MKKQKEQKQHMSLAIKILVGMVVGLLFGFLLKPLHSYWTYVTNTVGTVFLRLLKMTILPLVLCSIVGGIASIANLNKLKKIGIRFIIYWACASALAGACGLIWSYIIKPGVGIHLEEAAEAYSTQGVSVLDGIISYVPDNLFAALSNFSTVQVIVFAILAGIAISTLPEGKPKTALSNFFEHGNVLMMRLVEMVMKVAPIGVFCLMAEVSGTLGSEVLVGLGKMLVTQYIAYATMLLIVFPIILSVFAKVDPVKHYRNIFPVMILAFSSCSSAATLPLTMKSTRKEMVDLFKFKNLKSGILAGVFASFSYSLVLCAMNYVSNVSYVQVFRQLGLPIGMGLGVLILKERCTATKITGVILILAGLAVSVMKI